METTTALKDNTRMNIQGKINMYRIVTKNTDLSNKFYNII